MDAPLPLVAFVVAASVTPGPNNLLVLASGANWGVARTMPHIIGVMLGFPVMIVAVGLGISAVFEAAPWLHTALKYVGCAYLCWLAWRIASAGRPGESQRARLPMNLWQAMAFPWINPKAWTMVLSGMAVFVDPDAGNVTQVLGIAALFAAVTLPNGLAWAAFGRAIAGFLTDDARRCWFNRAMAVLLVALVLPALT
jgi:threonine/homoserine/homoserine lactone efflux protein